MSQSHGSISHSLHTPIAGKPLLRKFIESKTFYMFTFSFDSNFSGSLKHGIFFHCTIS